MKIESDRLIIRQIQATDLEGSFELRSDPQVSRYISVPLTKEQAEIKLQKGIQPWHAEDGRVLKLAVVLKSDNQYLGELMFKYISVDDSIGEIGYLFNPRHQGKGYAYEAASTLLNFLFHEFKLHKATAICDTRNTASWRVMEKLNMQKEGCFRSHMKNGDQWFDAYSYAVLVSDWPGVISTAK